MKGLIVHIGNATLSLLTSNNSNSSDSELHIRIQKHEHT